LRVNIWLCGKIQTEAYVSLYCGLTDHIRDMPPSNLAFPLLSAIFESIKTPGDLKISNAIM